MKHLDAGDANAINDFNTLWIAEFKKTNAFDIWNQITDPMLFDIIEARYVASNCFHSNEAYHPLRHPCAGKPNVVEDIGLRLQEGLQELHIQEQLAPTREAISRTIASSSTSFFKAVEGVRGRWSQRSASSLSVNGDSTSTIATTPVEITHSEADIAATTASKLRPLSTASMASQSSQSPSQGPGLRPLALSAAQTATETKAALSTWGSNLGTFISQRATRLTVPRTTSGNSASGVLSQGSSSSSSYSTQPPSTVGSPPLGETTEATPQQRSTSSPPPLTSLLSSWSWKAKSTSPPSAQSKPPLEVEEDYTEFKPRNLGEFEPPVKTDVRKSTDTGMSTDVQPGMAL